MEPKIKEVIRIAQTFEDAIVSQGLTDFAQLISLPAKDIYFLLCQLMPDPKTIIWGDPDIKWPGGETNG